MGKTMMVTYYHHSGFTVASGDVLLVFDYWTGKEKKLPEYLQLPPERLRQFKKIYVFITHDHADHLDEVVYEWEQYAPIQYVIAYDMEDGRKGLRMKPGDAEIFSDRLKVTAYGSTDKGVSFLAELDGVVFFHAGDLNFWHWREVSTAKEIADADVDFRAEVEPIAAEQKEKIDVAFFPVDPRMGMHFDAGANYFMMTVKPRLLLPMHFWGRSDVIVEFARRSRSRETEIVPLVHQGQSIRLDFDDDGFMNINVLQPPAAPQREIRLEHQAEVQFYDEHDPFNDPFHETDLPVDLNEEDPVDAE